MQHGHLAARCCATKSMSCSTTTSECRPASDMAELGGAHRLVVGHAGDRLVEQQQLRLLHQQHADLQPLLLAVRQRAGEPVGCVGSELDQLQRLGDAVARSASRAARCSVAPHAACRPSSRARGSRTPCAARTPSASGTCGRCRRARSRLRCRRVRSIVWPKNALPASGRVLPVMTSIIVVLPAPFGPMMQRSSPTSIEQRQLVQRLEAVEADGDVVEIEDRAVRRVDARRRRRACPPARRARASRRRRQCGALQRRRASARSHVALPLRRRLRRDVHGPRSRLRQEQRDEDEHQRRGRTARIRGTPA